jgi:hypothetical protein
LPYDRDYDGLFDGCSHQCDLLVTNNCIRMTIGNVNSHCETSTFRNSSIMQTYIQKRFCEYIHIFEFAKIDELFFSIDAMRIKKFSFFFYTYSPFVFVKFCPIQSGTNVQLYDCWYLEKLYRIIQLNHQIAKVAN